MRQAPFWKFIQIGTMRQRLDQEILVLKIHADFSLVLFRIHFVPAPFAAGRFFILFVGLPC